MLSGFAKVVRQADGGWVVRVVRCLQVAEQGFGRGDEAVGIGPESVAGQVLFAQAPDAFHQIEVRRGHRQPGRRRAAFLLGPPPALPAIGDTSR